MAQMPNTKALGRNQKEMLRWLKQHRRPSHTCDDRLYPPPWDAPVDTPARRRRVLQSLEQRGLVQACPGQPDRYELSPGGALYLAEQALDENQAAFEVAQARLRKAQEKARRLTEEREALFERLARARDAMEAQQT